MKIRDFYTLPIGKHFAKDDIYQYDLQKSLTDSGEWIIMISQKGSIFGPNFFVHPNEDFVYEERDRWRKGDFKYKTASYSMNMGMLHVHGDNYQYYLREIEIQPRGSFKEYVSKEINP